MDIKFEVNNKTKSPVKEDFFSEIIKRTIMMSGCDFLRKKNISISLALVSEKEMETLNKQYRQKDGVTDVLSFFEYETIEELEVATKDLSDGEVFLGELILCYDDIAKYARVESIPLEKELALVVSHGVLHLLGFAHGKKMFAIQDEIIKAV